jgi:1-acyl-sn-glycerol-3-phosphate acyltransferase
VDRAPRVLPLLNLLRRYHDHSVVGGENIPKRGGALIVTNHSFATYDAFLLGASILERRKRLVRALGDNLLFRVPGLAELMHEAGVVPAGRDSALKLLRKGYLLGLAPGGMREGLRESASEKYQVRWAERKGFVRLALKAQVPILLAACPAADDVFDVKSSFLTSLLYEKFHLPFVLVKGLRGLPIPRPVRLTHLLSKPLYPPKAPRGRAAFEAVVDEWHTEIISKMADLMEAAKELDR